MIGIRKQSRTLHPSLPPRATRIRKVLAQLETLADPRHRLVPYKAELKGYWKLRVGDYRLVCKIVSSGIATVLVIYVAHRSTVYTRKSRRKLLGRDE